MPGSEDFYRGATYVDDQHGPGQLATSGHFVDRRLQCRLLAALTRRRFLASGDLALMLFHVDSVVRLRHPSSLQQFSMAFNPPRRYRISQRASASFSESSVAESVWSAPPSAVTRFNERLIASYLLLTGRTARGFSRVSSSSCLSWRITRRSPSRSAYSTLSRPISTSSSWPR